MTNTHSKFETQTCTRCGGSGKYSYNAMHGDMCYGCQGKGWQYTKRGLAAVNYLTDLLMVPVTDIKVGDTVKIDHLFGGGFRKVTAVKQGPAKALAEQFGGGWVKGREDELMVHIQTDTVAIKLYPNQEIRKGFNKEEKAPLIEQALAYQATLTKAGKPRKQRASRQAQCLFA